MGRAARQGQGYRCRECGAVAAKWVGRCPECQGWGTLAEDVPRLRTVAAGPVSAPAVAIDEVAEQSAAAHPTGLAEVDRVLGGGLVPGSVVLLAGEPGVGKSTLLLQVAVGSAAGGRRSLVVSGEESAAQVRLRAGRIGALHPGLLLAAETDLGAVLGHLDAVRPDLLVVDSVQTVATADGPPGSPASVRDVAVALTQAAKTTGTAVVLVGHVTKDGAIAGPRALEHLVDVVLSFEGDRHTSLRVLRAVKNRFGPTDEAGCFELDDAGVRDLPDPSGLFMSRRQQPTPGTAVTVALEGRRPLVAEVQALVSDQTGPVPRRATSGLDGARTAMVLAVLERRGGVRLGRSDVFAATVGGVRLSEPAVDLGVALAVAGAEADHAVPLGLVAVGEVGLAGDVRPVTGLARRLAEAARLGFSVGLAPPGAAGSSPDGMTVVEVDSVRAALGALSVAGDGRPR